MLLAWTLGFALLGSLGAILGSAALLVLPSAARARLVSRLVSYATGTLLGAAWLGMIPTALAQAPAKAVSATVLGGMVLFFLLEKAVLWRHCHDGDCPGHSRAGPLILVGDAFHNFVDGIVIAAAFLVSVPLGVATALAVIAHEVPQELGDFAILLEGGYSRAKALLLNGLSASATIPGALLGHFWLAEAREAVPYMLALSAASFLYVATADLIPHLHRKSARGETAWQVSLLGLGIATIAFFRLGH